jgi:hypothetical protein
VSLVGRHVHFISLASTMRQQRCMATAPPLAETRAATSFLHDNAGFQPGFFTFVRYRRWERQGRVVRLRAVGVLAGKGALGVVNGV